MAAYGDRVRLTEHGAVWNVVGLNGNYGEWLTLRRPETGATRRLIPTNTVIPVHDDGDTDR